MRLVMHSLVLLPVRCPFLTNVRYYDSDWLSFQSYGSFDAFFVYRCALLDLSLILAMSVAVQINVGAVYTLAANCKKSTGMMVHFIPDICDCGAASKEAYDWNDSQSES